MSTPSSSSTSAASVHGERASGDQEHRPLRILVATKGKATRLTSACLSSSQHSSWYDVHQCGEPTQLIQLLGGTRYDVHIFDPATLAKLTDASADLRNRVLRSTILITEVEAPSRETLNCFGHLPKSRLSTSTLDHLIWQLARQQRLAGDVSQAPAPPVFETLLNLARMRLDAEGDLSTALRPLVEAAADALRAGRVTIWAFREDPKRLLCLNLYDRAPGEHSSGLEFPVALCPNYCMALERHRILAINDVLHDERCAELVPPYLSKVGIGALLDAPIYLDGQVVGLLCHAHFGGPRQWTDQERTLAATFADYVQLVFLAHQRHQAEQALRLNQQALGAAQRMEAVARLAGGLVHDFNNLLMVISGNAQILDGHRTKGDLSQGKRLLGNILDACSRAEHLAGRMRSLHGSQTGERQWVELGHLLTESERLIAATVGPHVTVSLEREPLPVWAHIEASDIQSAIINLACNARDAMPQGGTVRIRLQVETTSNDNATALATISVIDDGTGMSEETRARAFEPFFTTKGPERGTGLGLWNVATCLESLNGSATITSELGIGTEVHLHLPATTEPPQRDQSPIHPKVSTASANSTILLIERDDTVRATMHEMLEFLGYTVQSVADAAAARILWRSTRHLDLVLLDLALPGNSSLSCFHDLRNQHPNLPCLVLCAGNDDTLVATCLQDGAVGHLSKPFSLTACAQTVEKLLTGVTPKAPTT